MKCLQHDFDTLTRKYSLDRIYYAQDRGFIMHKIES